VLGGNIVGLGFARAVGEGFREQLTILNHDDEAVDLTVRIEAASDFADLFEVKDALAKKGKYYSEIQGRSLRLGYERETEVIRRWNAPVAVSGPPPR